MASQKTHKPSGRKPAHTIKAGAIRATIWENKGALGPFYAATLSRSYRNASGNWRQGASFGAHQLDDLMNAALEAKEWMAAHPHLAN
jgi:hypothetical protein